MKLSNKEISEVLIKEKYVSVEDANEALEVAEKKGSNIAEVLYEKEALNKDLLGQAFAEHYAMDYFDLNSSVPDKQTVLKIPEEIAKKYNLILFSENDKEVILLSDGPFPKEEVTEDDLNHNLKKLFGSKKIKLLFSLTEDIEDVLKNYRHSLQTRFTEIIEGSEQIAPEVLSEILTDAIGLFASDIHFEPQESEVKIRFRIDGILIEAGTIKKELFDNILNRIKVLARLRIDEHFASQDGAIRFSFEEKSIDLRISIVPTLDGETVVIRILSEYIRSLTLNDLGLSESDQKLLERAYKKTFGMILTTGPTGSGKTTTLYSLLKKLQTSEVNITTIEDPVEYKIPGINQIQVNNATNLTFAKGLKAIVRQDPNIILVGEIRDGETADIAINAALTGHLLLSTFHANDAATAIPRLVDMGAEPFLLASTINLIISQRLVRKICNNCRFTVKMRHNDIQSQVPDSKKYFKEETFTVYKGKGCAICNGSGYKGRIALYELIYVTPELQELILTNPPSKIIRDFADKQGARTFFEDGIEKVKNGITTLEELIRVAPVSIESSKLYERK